MVKIMVITQIKNKKANKFEIYVDGEFWGYMHPETIAENLVKEGKEYSGEDLDYLKSVSQTKLAKERALYLITYRDHSKKELITKLKQDYDELICYQVADKMENIGFINDENYARKLAHDLILVKKMGKRGAIYKMTQKGIDKDLAQECIDEIDIDPVEQLIEVIKRKYTRYLNDQKGIAKISNAFLRQGHSYSDVKSALSACISDFDQD